VGAAEAGVVLHCCTRVRVSEHDEEEDDDEDGKNEVGVSERRWRVAVSGC
jgi:hypothetical protein